MPIKQSRSKGHKGGFVLTSPKTGKALAYGTKAQVTKRAAQIAYFRGK